MNFTTKYWMEIIVVEILLIGNTAGNLSLASPPLLTIQIRFVTGIEALSLFHSLEWKVVVGGGGGVGGNPDSEGGGGGGGGGGRGGLVGNPDSQ